MRRAVAILTIVIGLGLVAIPLAYSMFSRTDDAERILDRFTFLTLVDNPARYLDEAEVTRAGSAELVDEAIPALAADAGLSDREFDRLAQTMFPAYEKAREEVPQANEFSVRYSEQLAAVDEKFQSVYDIPIRSVPLTATPWLFVLAGIAFLVAGLIALRIPAPGAADRAPMIAILSLGVAMMVGLVAFSAMGKATDGEDVKDFASRGLTSMAASAAQEGSAALDDLVAETEQVILPELARRQGIPVTQLENELNAEYPDAARFLSEWDVIGPRLARLADAVEESVVEFDSAGELPISLPVWLLLGAAAVLSVGAGIALVRAAPGPR